MALRERLTEWLDIRAAEFRVVMLSVLGAFFIMGFAVLAGALRDAFYLRFFDAATLPYILYASLVLGLPAVALFSRQMARRSPHNVMRTVVGVTSAGLLLLYIFVLVPAPRLDSRVASVLFYLWTVVSTLLLTSGFWIIVSDVFAVREAKRLFGLISAGGAMGTLVTGVSLSGLLTRFEPIHLVPLLVGYLLLALVALELVPRDRLGRRHRGPEESRQGALESVRALTSNRHLRLIAGIVLLTSAASYVVTWQLQEAIQVTAATEAARAGLVGEDAAVAVTTRIASFMGAFRGWTGGLAFVIQVFVAGRVLAGAGVAWSLALLPLALLFGSAGMLVFPGLLMATLVRGADNTLGKSLYRTVAELLWIPVSPALRRRAKAFIDSMVDSAGDPSLCDAGAASIALPLGVRDRDRARPAGLRPGDGHAVLHHAQKSSRAERKRRRSAGRGGIGPGGPARSDPDEAGYHAGASHHGRLRGQAGAREERSGDSEARSRGPQPIRPAALRRQRPGRPGPEGNRAVDGGGCAVSGAAAGAGRLAGSGRPGPRTRGRRGGALLELCPE
jgi:AAA family ATP:ADP antiporter